jgi:hypothetical protein
MVRATIFGSCFTTARTETFTFWEETLCCEICPAGPVAGPCLRQMARTRQTGIFQLCISLPIFHSLAGYSSACWRLKLSPIIHLRGGTGGTVSLGEFVTTNTGDDNVGGVLVPLAYTYGHRCRHTSFCHGPITCESVPRWEHDCHVFARVLLFSRRCSQQIRSYCCRSLLLDCCSDGQLLMPYCTAKLC